MTPSPRHVRLQLKNRAAEFERVVAVLAGWRTEGGLPAAAAHDARLVLEEAFINIVNYGHPDGREHEIGLELELRPDRLDMVLDDDGVAFDPTAARAPAAVDPRGEQPLGMIGLQLMRAYATRWHYERREGRNVLALSKHFGPTSG